MGIIDRLLKKTAKKAGYQSVIEMLWDYDLVPSVRMPKHKKQEIVPLIIKQLKKKD